VRFTKIICVRNSWCIVRNSWCIIRTLNALMHTLMMHHDVRVDARVDARVNAHAMQFAWIRMRCSLRECACDAVCVNAYAIQLAWIRMRCSLRKYACDAVCIFAKSVKSTKSSLFDLNDYCRFQIIMLVKIWFKSISQLIVSSGINSLDLTDEIFCWC